MNISIRIVQLKGRTYELAHRFPAAVFWQTVLFLVGAAAILLRPDDSAWYAENNVLFEHLMRLMPAIFAAWLTAAACRLLTELCPVKSPLLLSGACSGVLFVLLAYIGTA